jgi:hypothetical protein
MWTDPGNILIAHRHMNVDIGTDAAQFTEKGIDKWDFPCSVGTIPKKFRINGKNDTGMKIKSRVMLASVTLERREFLFCFYFCFIS